MPRESGGGSRCCARQPEKRCGQGPNDGMTKLRLLDPHRKEEHRPGRPHDEVVRELRREEEHHGGGEGDPAGGEAQRFPTRGAFSLRVGPGDGVCADGSNDPCERDGSQRERERRPWPGPAPHAEEHAQLADEAEALALLTPVMRRLKRSCASADIGSP